MPSQQDEDERINDMNYLIAEGYAGTASRIRDYVQLLKDELAAEASKTESMRQLAIRLGDVIEKERLSYLAKIDSCHGDTNLINYLEHLLHTEGVMGLQQATRGLDGVNYNVRNHLQKHKDIYNGALRVPRDKKGKPI